MEFVQTMERARPLFAALARPLALVPTMGALHDGHLELVRRARARCAAVAVSLFVNPLQFGPGEDLAGYPRDLGADRAQLAQAGVDLLFAPEPEAMYGPAFASYIEVEGPALRYEGTSRPGHFRGVATVIAKLLHLARPDVLFLGQKDAQQAIVLRRMIEDLDFGVELAVVPTVREADGLAMSSRNRYLDQTRRAQARSLYQALLAMRAALEAGAPAEAARAAGTAALDPAAMLEYLDLVDAHSFAPLERLEPPAYVIAAARFGSTRLIDNLRIGAPGDGEQEAGA